VILFWAVSVSAQRLELCRAMILSPHGRRPVGPLMLGSRRGAVLQSCLQQQPLPAVAEGKPKLTEILSEVHHPTQV